MGQYSEFLFARPSFFEGMGRVLDVGGTMNIWNSAPDAASADYWAACADWFATGDDIASSAAEFTDQRPEVIIGEQQEPAVQECPETTGKTK